MTANNYLANLVRRGAGIASAQMLPLLPAPYSQDSASSTSLPAPGWIRSEVDWQQPSHSDETAMLPADPASHMQMLSEPFNEIDSRQRADRILSGDLPGKKEAGFEALAQHLKPDLARETQGPEEAIAFLSGSGKGQVQPDGEIGRPIARYARHDDPAGHIFPRSVVSDIEPNRIDSEADIAGQDDLAEANYLKSQPFRSAAAYEKSEALNGVTQNPSRRDGGLENADPAAIEQSPIQQRIGEYGENAPVTGYSYQAARSSSDRTSPIRIPIDGLPSIRNPFDRSPSMKTPSARIISAQGSTASISSIHGSSAGNPEPENAVQEDLPFQKSQASSDQPPETSQDLKDSSRSNYGEIPMDPHPADWKQTSYNHKSQKSRSFMKSKKTIEQMREPMPLQEILIPKKHVPLSISDGRKNEGDSAGIRPIPARESVLLRPMSQKTAVTSSRTELKATEKSQNQIQKVINVNIGTVEVKAEPQPPLAKPLARAGSVGFEEYAAIRSYAGWMR